MSEFINWINKSLTSISDTNLFKGFFLNIHMDKIDDQYFLENLTLGIDVIFYEDLTVRAVHFYSNNYQNANQFLGELPNNLSFSYNKKKVHKILGEPDVYGGGHKSRLLGYIQNWEKFYFKNYSLHITYSENENNLLLITIGSLRFEEDVLPE